MCCRTNSMQISAAIDLISLHTQLKYHKIGLISLRKTNCVSNILENEKKHFFKLPLS